MSMISGGLFEVDRANPLVAKIDVKQAIGCRGTQGHRPTEGAPDVYLRVIGIDALAEELRTRGAEILDGPEDRIYGQRELVVTDCNGSILCFGEATGERAT
jgi:predicted enzyme related to lactoylglutathione lyase